ncbi:MAG: thiamine biosynthesis protein [Gammaproteobacteria bacterium]|nr:thiamine biosynthesis protein [Gammaproteobacteria bacterium]
MTPFKVALDWYMNPDQAPILVAAAKGYFKDEGLDVQLLTPTDVSEPIDLVAADKVNVATTYSPGLMMDVVQGMPIVWIATEVPQPLDCLTVLKSSGIKTPADLKGKTIGYTAGAMGSVMIRRMLEQSGLSLNDVHLVDVKMNLIQALVSGRIDAASSMMRFVEPIQIEKMGYPVTVFYPENYGVVRYDELILVANRAEAKKPEYAAFVRALTQGARFLKAHPEESWQEVSQAYPAAFKPTPEMESINHAMWLAGVPYFTNTPGAFDQARYQALAKFLKQEGLINRVPNQSEYLP